MNQSFRATAANMSGNGVLLRFEPVQLAVSDHVNWEFRILRDADKSLPYWV